MKSLTYWVLYLSLFLAGLVAICTVHEPIKLSLSGLSTASSAPASHRASLTLKNADTSVSSTSEDHQQPAAVESEEIVPLWQAFEEQLQPLGLELSRGAAGMLQLLPALAALFAFIGGVWLKQSSDQSTRQDRFPASLMEMGVDTTEATPLAARRGVLTALATLPLAVASPAFARSGGRVGGSAFQSRKSPPPRPQNPATGTTNVYVAPPPVYAAPGYGFAPASPFGYGMGISRGELLALSALELGQAFVREQQRQAFLQQQLEVQRKLGRDEAQIQALQQQLADQEARMRDMQQVMMQKGVPTP